MRFNPEDVIRVSSPSGEVAFYRLVPAETRLCACCGDPFPITDQRLIYCSKRCGALIRQRRNRLRHQLAATGVRA